MDRMLDRPWTTLSGQSNPIDREFISLSDILGFLKLYARSILLCLLLGLVGAAFYVVTTDRIYTATAQILIDPKNPQLLQPQAGEVNLSLDTAQVESQIAVMTSEKIAMMVISDLKLLDDPKFNRPPTSGLLARLGKAATALGGMFGISADESDPAVRVGQNQGSTDGTRDNEEFEHVRRAISNFQDGLTVRRVGVSYALEIRFSLANPELASRIANAIAEAFIREQLETKAASARQGGDWLERRLQELRVQMNTATQIAQEFRARHDYRVAPRPQDQGAAGVDTYESGAGNTEPTLEELETTADTYRKMYESFLQAYAGSVSQQSYPVADARLITPASRPLSASHPRPKLAMAFGGVFGIMLGLGLAYLRHMFDRTVRTPRQVREELALECIGELPSARIPFKPEELRYPHSKFSYSLRKIRTAISLSDGSHPVRRLGITSTQNSPNKHALVCSLATLYAAGGSRVLVIDADVQRPALTEWLLAGNEPADWPMTKIREPDIMTVKNLGFDVMLSALSVDGWLLDPKTMETALNSLTSYDMILVDLPAFASGADSLAAAAVLDGVVLVAESGVTSIVTLKELVRSLHAYHASMVGVVLTGSTVEPRRFRSGRMARPGPAPHHDSPQDQPARRKLGGKPRPS